MHDNLQNFYCLLWFHSDQPCYSLIFMWEEFHSVTQISISLDLPKSRAHNFSRVQSTSYEFTFSAAKRSRERERWSKLPEPENWSEGLWKSLQYLHRDLEKHFFHHSSSRIIFEITKTADIWRCHQFSREMTTEKRVQKVRTDDVPLPRSG